MCRRVAHKRLRDAAYADRVRASTRPEPGTMIDPTAERVAENQVRNDKRSINACRTP